KEGKLLAAAGKSPLIVKTIYAQIQITPGALAVIEQPRLGIMRAATLAGQGSAVVLTVADKQQDFTLCSGEELLIADKALNAIELVDPDGIERQPLEGKISVTGLLVQKNKFDIHAMVHHQHKLLVCNAGSFTISHPAYKFLAIEANKKYLGNQTPNIHIITAGHGPYVCLTQNE
ncbi:MAG: hypothetical protein HY711_02865, partial [Candidatus Melainabacteria bacterium]|nr:hypothetical protein [Candidatus Melainabacteria bacterium]